MHKTLGGLGTHLCDLHFPLPHPDGLLQVPVADLLPDVYHHLWSSELRQLLPELLVQSQGLGPVLGGGRDQLDCGAPLAVPASWDLLALATPPIFNVVLNMFTFSKEWVKSQDSDSSGEPFHKSESKYPLGLCHLLNLSLTSHHNLTFKDERI